jgi:hypothetical protein
MKENALYEWLNRIGLQELHTVHTAHLMPIQRYIKQSFRDSQKNALALKPFEILFMTDRSI